jgi:hypothetical protein
MGHPDRRFQRHMLSTGDFLTTQAVELVAQHPDLGPELELDPPPPAAIRLARPTVESLTEGELSREWPDELFLERGWPNAEVLVVVSLAGDCEDRSCSFSPAWP